MECITELSAMRTWVRGEQAAGHSLGFVPTMGALHEGHRSLIASARAACKRVVVSIFVNPIQFDRAEDFDAYPQPRETDLAACREAGVDVVFMPTASAMYPEGYATVVDLGGPLADKLCGATRPGHFRGVCTVVAKLFNLVQPDRVFVGEKDLQQALIIRKMVADLSFPVVVQVCPTVREPDGLAMSSRNARLSATARRTALCVPRGLERARRAFLAGEIQAMKLIEIVAEEVLSQPGSELDYADLVDPVTFEEATTANEGCVLAVAAFIGGIRLIDHVMLGGAGIPVDVDAE